MWKKSYEWAKLGKDIEVEGEEEVYFVPAGDEMKVNNEDLRKYRN